MFDSHFSSCTFTLFCPNKCSTLFWCFILCSEYGKICGQCQQKMTAELYVHGGLWARCEDANVWKGKTVPLNEIKEIHLNIMIALLHTSSAGSPTETRVDCGCNLLNCGVSEVSLKKMVMKSSISKIIMFQVPQVNIVFILTMNKMITFNVNVLFGCTITNPQRIISQLCSSMEFFTFGFYSQRFTVQFSLTALINVVFSKNNFGKPTVSYLSSTKQHI